MSESQADLHREFVRDLKMHDAVAELSTAIASVEAALRLATYAVARKPAMEANIVQIVNAATNTCRVTVHRIIRGVGAHDEPVA